MLFGSILRHVHLRHHATEVLDCPDRAAVAVAIGDPPGRWRTPVWRQLAQLPDLVAAFGRHTPAMLRGFSALAAIEDCHPRRPHWYLVDVATAPDRQGRGHGRRLLLERLRRCDTTGVPAYLEASSSANARLYERLGFASGREGIELPGGGPTVVPMWRDPGSKIR